MGNPCTIAELKHALRNPFAFPGGYTLAFYCWDGERLCPKCVRAEFKQVVREKATPLPRSYHQWRVDYIDVHWEGPPDFCAHCNVELPSEYGDPDQPEVSP
jgi:hypothetical protein